MGSNKPQLQTAEGLDHEIELLRGMIRDAADMQNRELSFGEQLDLLESVGRGASSLARLMKMRRDLASQEEDPAALLREALLELEKEWPELKAFGEQFTAKKEEETHAG